MKVDKLIVLVALAAVVPTIVVSSSFLPAKADVNGQKIAHRHKGKNHQNQNGSSNDAASNSNNDDDGDSTSIGSGENEGIRGGGFFPGANMQNLPNFHEVHYFLFRGGEPSPEGYSMLAHMGVRTIIDLRDPSEADQDKQLCYERGLRLINLPMNRKEPPQPQLVNRFTEIINKARANPDHGVVFVHCQDGRDRTGCMIGIYRVLSDDWTSGQAQEEMRKYGFDPKYGALRRAVQAYADSK